MEQESVVVVDPWEQVTSEMFKYEKGPRQDLDVVLNDVDVDEKAMSGGVLGCVDGEGEGQSRLVQVATVPGEVQSQLKLGRAESEFGGQSEVVVGCTDPYSEGLQDLDIRLKHVDVDGEVLLGVVHGGVDGGGEGHVAAGMGEVQSQLDRTESECGVQSRVGVGEGLPEHLLSVLKSGGDVEGETLTELGQVQGAEQDEGEMKLELIQSGVDGACGVQFRLGKDCAVELGGVVEH